MNYQEAVKYIEDSNVRGSILGLDRIRLLCELLGNPECDFEVIHIAGTNGKGSTSAFISSVLNEAGYLTGMYYSPALSGIYDHYMVGGELISEEDYAKCVSIIYEANEGLHNAIGEYATQFELETALAFVYFRMKGCKYAVIETGLGGRDDATNVISNELLCVFVSISYDHMAILGNTLYEIARVKAGIITSHCKVVAFDSGEEVLEAIREECNIYANDLQVVEKDDIHFAYNIEGNMILNYSCFENVELSLHGVFQADNAATALEAIKSLKEIGIDISDDAIISGMKKAYWPFRFEKIHSNPDIYVDGAHNKDAADKLNTTIVSELDGRKLVFVIGMFKDKDYEYLISKNAGLADRVYALTVRDKNRALSADIIAKIASKYCDNAMACDSIEMSALEATKAVGDYKKSGQECALVAFGSLSYLNEFKECIRNIYNVYNGKSGFDI